MDKDDTFVQENIIMGTGIIEAILAGSLATHGKHSLNIECSGHYSGNMRTLTIRDMRNCFQENEQANRYVENGAYGFEYKFKNPEIESFDKFIELYGFRDYSIDFVPKVIFSNSNAADRFIEAKIDDYVHFRTFRGLYTPIGDELDNVPTQKGDIFSNKNLSLFEKKELFNFLSVAMRYFNKEFKDKEEQNSINDFKKNVYSEHTSQVDKLITIETIKYQHFIDFLRESGVKSDRLIRLIAYCLCNYKYNPFRYKANKFEDQSAKEMLRRLSRFIESLNYHSVLPYLFPIYGTGDIPQIFTRINTVYGGILMCGDDFTVLDYKYEDDTHKMKFKIKEFVKTVHANNIYLGGDYASFGKNVLGVSDFIVEEITVVSRSAIIIKIYEKRDDSKSPYYPKDDSERIIPFLVQIPDNYKALGNQHPISVMVTDKSCGSTPLGLGVVYIDYILNSEDASQKVDPEAVDAEVMCLIKKKFSELAFEEQLVFRHLHRYRNSDSIPLGNNVVLLPDDDLGLDFERSVQFSQEFVNGPDSQNPLFNRQGPYYGASTTKEEDDLEIDEDSKQLLDDLESFKF